MLQSFNAQAAGAAITGTKTNAEQSSQQYHMVFYQQHIA